MHVLCLCMKYMHEKRAVHYSSVYGSYKYCFSYESDSSNVAPASSSHRMCSVDKLARQVFGFSFFASFEFLSGENSCSRITSQIAKLLQINANNNFKET